MGEPIRTGAVVIVHKNPLIARALGELRAMGAVVVKNPDLWGSLARGGDWDLAVPDPARGSERLQDAIGPATKVATRSYVRSLYFEWGEVDLLPGILWRGHELISYQRLAGGADFGQGPLAVARLAHQAVAACVYPTLAYGSYKSRYNDLWTAARGNDRAELSSLLASAFGQTAANQLIMGQDLRERRRELKHTLRMHSLQRDPLGTLRRSVDFLMREAAIRSRS